MSSEANAVNLRAVVGRGKAFSKQHDKIQSNFAPGHLQKPREPLQCFPRAGGLTSDDPICIDSEDDGPTPIKTQPEHVSQSLIQQSSHHTDSSNLAGSMDSSKCQQLAKKRQRSSAVSTSQSASADSGERSQQSHLRKGRHYILRKRLTFPVTKQEDHVSTTTASDAETGIWTFRIQKESDSNPIDVIEIFDDSDNEDPQKSSQLCPPTLTQVNLDANHVLRSELEELSASGPEQGANFVSKTLTSKRKEPTLSNDTKVHLFEIDGKSLGCLRVTSKASFTQSSYDRPTLDQKLAVPSKAPEGHELSDDETSSPDDCSDSSGPVDKPTLTQPPEGLGVATTIVPRESSKPQSTHSFQSPNPHLLERQLLDLLQPPPLRRSMISHDPRIPEEFKSLLFSPQNRSQWMSSKSNNLLEDWNDMARRLRQWQVREDATMPKRCETVFPTELKKTLSGLSHSKYQDPPNFQGGVDPPISAREESHDLGAMNFVPMYNQQYVDEKTGLPCRKFTVIGSPDHIMYSFLLQVRTSSIPNAGYGLFLKFLGAKELKPSKRARGECIRESRPVNPNMFFDKLSLFHPRGFGMNLTINGEHLKAPYNSLYTRRTLQMTLPDDRLHIRKQQTRTVNLKFSDPDIIYDDDELEGLREPTKRIGHYGLFTEDDFVDAPRRTFSSLHSNCGFIDIGRYGPFLKEDRKIEIIFDVKNFLFSFEPGMWSFGVPEKILGRDQVIDITDDLTGEPHEEARRNLTMYVNEVGHNHSLRESIHALDEDDRTITYFLMIDNCMKKGDEMEVFVNYKQSYEDNRERKGYGKKNLSGTEKCDEHMPSRLKRNFVDRREVLTCIHEAEVVDLYWLVDFCFELAQSLQSLLNDFLATAISTRRAVCPVTARQITAVRRLDWLVSFLENRNNHLKETIAPGRHQAAYYMLNQSTDSLSRMRWGRWTELFAVLDSYPMMLDKSNKNLRMALDQEGVEETSFAVADKLPMPLHESRWCPLAIDLTYALCTVTARTLWQNLDRHTLAEIYVSLALRASAEIRNPLDLSRLAFPVGFSDPFVTSLESQPNGPAWIALERGAKVLVTTRNTGNVGGHAPNTTEILMGCQSPLNIVPNQAENVQRIWYLARQVYVIIDSLAQLALPAFSRDHLQRLLGIQTTVIQDVLIKDSIETQNALRSQTTVRRHKQNQNRDKVTTVKSQKKIGPQRERVNNILFWGIIWTCLTDKIGWRLEHGNRPNDFYFLPPGVARGKGFRNRVDFFDSVVLVLDFIKKEPKWNDIPEVKACIDEYYACKNLYESLQATRKMPSFSDQKEKVTWLRGKVRGTATTKD